MYSLGLYHHPKWAFLSSSIPIFLAPLFAFWVSLLFPFPTYSWVSKKVYKLHKTYRTSCSKPSPGEWFRDLRKSSYKRSIMDTLRVMRSELHCSLHFDWDCSFMDEGFSSNRICTTVLLTVSFLPGRWHWVESFQGQNDFRTFLNILYEKKN